MEKNKLINIFNNANEIEFGTVLKKREALKRAIKNSFYGLRFDGKNSILSSYIRGENSNMGHWLERVFRDILKERGFSLNTTISKSGNRECFEINGDVKDGVTKACSTLMDNIKNVKKDSNARNKKTKIEICDFYEKVMKKSSSNKSEKVMLLQIEKLLKESPSENYSNELMFFNERIEENKNYFEKELTSLKLNIKSLVDVYDSDVKNKSAKLDIFFEDENTVYLLEVKFGGKLDSKNVQPNKKELLNAYSIIISKPEYKNKDVKIYFGVAEDLVNIAALKSVFTTDELLIGNDLFSFICGCDVSPFIDEVFNVTKGDCFNLDIEFESVLLEFLKEEKEKSKNSFKYKNSILKIDYLNFKNEKLKEFIIKEIKLIIPEQNDEYASYLYEKRQLLLD